MFSTLPALLLQILTLVCHHRFLWLFQSVSLARLVNLRAGFLVSSVSERLTTMPST